MLRKEEMERLTEMRDGNKQMNAKRKREHDMREHPIQTRSLQSYRKENATPGPAWTTLCILVTQTSPQPPKTPSPVLPTLTTLPVLLGKSQ